MILSSADILRILGGNSIIRLSAKLQVVDGRPALSGREGLYIYIQRFPELKEFEATFTLWIESDGSEPDDIVIAELKKLLPKVQVTQGLMTKVTTTEFRSESTQEAPAAAPKAQVDTSGLEARFEALAEDIQDQMLLVHSGRNGADGRDGRDGQDGRDGRDMVATDANLEDLNNVEDGIVKEKGQVLTWDGVKWTNLFVPQIYSSGTTVVSGSGDAVSATVQWKYHTTPVETEPDTGDFHADSADGELVTEFHVSNSTNRGNDITILLRDLLAQGYDRMYVALTDDLSQAHLYAITGSTETAGGFLLNVTHIDTAGTEPDFVSPKTYEFYLSKSATGGGGGVPEAPIDGQQYARQNAGWSVVADSGIPEAPQDGNYYVRQNGNWIDLKIALSALGVDVQEPVDAGNFTTGFTPATNNVVYDAGNFTTNTSDATTTDTLEGGSFT